MKASKKNFNKKNNPFDIFTDNENRSKIFESFNFLEMLDRIRRDNFRVNNWYACNFIFDTSDYKECRNTKSESYSSGVIPQINEDAKADISSYDIIRTKEQVTITIEMPDISERDINLKVSRNSIEIMPNNPLIKYHKIFKLPCRVERKTMTFTFKNGVLDIVIERSN